MNRKTLLKLTALLIALCAVFTLTACKRGTEGDDASRMDITVSASDNDPWHNTDPYVDLSDIVIRPERRMPFEPNEEVIEIFDPNIKMIEINQCLSYGFDTDTGELYLMQNFVAGKETAVFVTFNEPLDLSAHHVLTIEKDGATVTQLSPVAIPDEYTLLFQPTDIADVGYWSAGAYSFKFETDGGWAVRTANFFDSTTLKILGVPVKANYGGRVETCTDLWRDSIELLIAAYPIARADVEFVMGPELDLSDSRYDLLTDPGSIEVWRALTNLQTPDEAYTLIIGFVPSAPWFPSINSYVNGYTCGLPGNVIWEGNPEMLKTVAHEVAHCYNIGDEYEGGSLNLDLNVPPYGMSGHIIWRSTPVTADNPLVIGGPRMGLIGPGSVIYPEQRPYYVAGSRLLGGVTSYMGCGMDAEPYTRWVTSEVYNHIFETFTGVTPDMYGGSYSTGLEEPEPDYWGQCPNCYMSVNDPRFYVECWQCLEFVQVTGYSFQCPECAANWLLDDYEDDLYLECSACRYFIWYDSFIEHNSGDDYEPREEPQGTFTQITGFVNEDNTFSADPWFTYETNRNVLTPGALGDYRVYVYDSDGALLSAADFAAGQQTNVDLADNQIFVDAQRHPVSAAVRLPDGAARFVIRSGDEVIFSRDVSQNAPTVAFTGLSSGQQLSDAVTLTWEANDADGDELYFNIWYCPKEGQSFNIASNITGRSMAVDLSELPGTNDGYFHIYATDGVWTSEAYSPSVKVPYKAPIIYSMQDEIPEYRLTEEITLNARIYDLQDGWLWGENGTASWLYNGIERSTCSYLWIWPYDLAPGEHTFTCVATNSAGMTVQKDFTFRILDDESDLPDGWSRDYIVDALTHGFVLPLDTPEAPVTRVQYAKIMAMFYNYMATAMAGPDGGNPLMDIDFLGLVTDCGRLDGEPAVFSALIVAIGAMDAPGGLFNPMGTLTEREALEIMFKVLAIAIDEQGLIAEIGDLELLQGLFLRMNVIDAEGPNALHADERLTLELALVRVNGILMYIAELKGWEL